MYAGVIIDNKTDHTDSVYTYICDEQVSVGAKVYVPFGRGNREKSAYVVSTKEVLEEEHSGLKTVLRVDEEISLTEEMMDTALFMKKRYLCRSIDAIECFTPSGSSSKRGKKRVPLKEAKADIQKIEKLTEEQTHALTKIYTAIYGGSSEIFLLHGVTGSGKTEVYMRSIAKALETGKGAIMLVPEISLTKQIIERFFGRFGRENIAVLHSKLSMGERYDEWQRIRKGQAKIVIGARSAVFAPLENIGLVIMDEEHETSYKSDKAPKYETMEIALRRLKAFGGSLILGSATPSVTSYQRAKDGLYHLLEMKQRYNEVPLPRVRVKDMREELLAGNKSILSRELALKIEKTLEAGEQVILFLNRRGYSTFISCRECGYVLKCKDCGISMTYHKSAKTAVCHYCGGTAKVPDNCPECNSRYIRHFGTGTEKVEEFIAETFPNAKVGRLDLDTVRTKGSVERILGEFCKGKTNVLIGTQLVAKGLDFRNVGLVGVISADVSLNIPDFRSAERTFQLITQAAGRAGRGDSRGEVVIQTYTPEHYAVQQAAKQDYNAFFNQEIRLRKLLKYPPYCDLVQIMFTGEREDFVEKLALRGYQLLSEMMSKEQLENVFKPQAAPVKQEAGKFRYQILIKIPKGERNTYTAFVKTLRQRVIDSKRITKNKKSDYMMLVDFNPYSLI